MALLVTTCQDRTPQLTVLLSFQILSDFFNSAAKCCPCMGKTHVFAKNIYLRESRIPHPLPSSRPLADFISAILQRSPAFILHKSCSPGCAEHSPRMNGVPPRFPRCAKHRVRITWLRWLRKTWYSVTSTGRAAPIAKENILLSLKDLQKKHAKIQNREIARGSRKRHDFYDSCPIGLISIFMNLEEHSTTFFCASYSSQDHHFSLS